MTSTLSTINEEQPVKRTAISRVRFSKKFLDGVQTTAPNSKKWEWHYDIQVPGLAIGVGPTGVKTFYLIRKFKGQSRRILIGKYPTIDFETARTVAQNHNNKMAQGIDPTDDDHDAMTFGQLFEKFMVEYSHQRNRTSNMQQACYSRYLATDKYGVNLQNRKLKDIKRDDIRKIFAGVSQHAPIHANRVLALIRSVFNRAISWDLVTAENPCKGISRNKETSRERTVNSHELPYLFKSLDVDKNETLRDFVFVALFTGARRSNVLGMKWEDIDLDSSSWKIGMTKNGTPQTVPLIPELMELLKQRRQTIASEWVFPSHGATGHYVESKRGWKTVLERATAYRLIEKIGAHVKWTEQEKWRALAMIETSPASALREYHPVAASLKIELKPLDMRDIRVHDLRRTLGSWQADKNVSLAIIGRTLNHLSPQSTKIYARLSLDPIRQAMETATTAMLQHRSITN